MNHGKFAWNELATTDPERARAFYAETLGWTFESFALPGTAYWIARSGEELVGGLGGMETGAIKGANQPYWFPFIEVDDVDARLAKARAAGAMILQEPEDVPNVGRVAVLRDPTGAAVGWMTSLSQA